MKTPEKDLVIAELYDACRHALQVSTATLADLKADGEQENGMAYQGEKLLNDRLKRVIELTKRTCY
jgi:hypothetical protein